MLLGFSLLLIVSKRHEGVYFIMFVALSIRLLLLFFPFRIRLCVLA